MVTFLCFMDYVCLFLFFFSSRRRHTRFDCDWSSDVCSSGLPTVPTPCRSSIPCPPKRRTCDGVCCLAWCGAASTTVPTGTVISGSSRWEPSSGRGPGRGGGRLRNGHPSPESSRGPVGRPIGRRVRNYLIWTYGT